KGRRRRSVPFGTKTSASLDRYLRSRRTHRHAELAALWVGSKGALTTSGVTQLVARRCADAGIPAIGLHRFRHTTAHEWLAAGGQEGDLERLMGWSARGGMVRHYARSAADERAREAHKRLGLADRF
ncbi:MAG: tyrosine-type recombinase/integrase, partial [Gemmatimonadetes bacterium]|nr:tyrosine-type recombinase/integrase [Gemmatimonadota bacterium]